MQQLLPAAHTCLEAEAPLLLLLKHVVLVKWSKYHIQAARSIAGVEVSIRASNSTASLFCQ